MVATSDAAEPHRFGKRSLRRNEQPHAELVLRDLGGMAAGLRRRPQAERERQAWDDMTTLKLKVRPADVDAFADFLQRHPNVRRYKVRSSCR